MVAQSFVDLFDQTIADYRLFNYILDIVPRVPLELGFGYMPPVSSDSDLAADRRGRLSESMQAATTMSSAIARCFDYEETIKATTPVPPRSASCILGPETGNPSLVKRLVSDLASFVPV